MFKNFNTVLKGEDQCPPPFAQNAPEGPVLDPALERFPLEEGRSPRHLAM